MTNKKLPEWLINEIAKLTEARDPQDGPDVHYALCEGARLVLARAEKLVDAFDEILRITDRKHVAWDRAHQALAEWSGE